MISRSIFQADMKKTQQFFVLVFALRKMPREITEGHENCVLIYWRWHEENTRAHSHTHTHIKKQTHVRTPQNKYQN